MIWSTRNISYTHTVCPRSSNQFYVASYYIIWVTTFWTYSTKLYFRLKTKKLSQPSCIFTWPWFFCSPILYGVLQLIEHSNRWFQHLTRNKLNIFSNTMSNPIKKCTKSFSFYYSLIVQLQYISFIQFILQLHDCEFI